MGNLRYKTADATVSSYSAAAVTTSDSSVIPVTRALYIGADGNVKVDMAVDGTVTFVGLKGGTVLPIQVVRVYATGTTSTNIVALY
jgi:hypothetical protein